MTYDSSSSSRSSSPDLLADSPPPSKVDKCEKKLSSLDGNRLLFGDSKNGNTRKDPISIPLQQSASKSTSSTATRNDLAKSNSTATEPTLPAASSKSSNIKPKPKRKRKFYESSSSSEEDDEEIARRIAKRIAMKRSLSCDDKSLSIAKSSVSNNNRESFKSKFQINDDESDSSDGDVLSKLRVAAKKRKSESLAVPTRVGGTIDLNNKKNNEQNGPSQRQSSTVKASNKTQISFESTINEVKRPELKSSTATCAAPESKVEHKATKSSPAKQSTLKSFIKSTTASPTIKSPSTKATKSLQSNNTKPTSTSTTNHDPIIPKPIETPSNISWSSHKNCLLIRTILSPKSETAPRSKVAGFDLDQTLINWRCSGWPNRLEHYELWSPRVISKLQSLHDEGYKLVIFTNQGGIRGAFTGKNATRIKAVIDWIASLIGRPLWAVCSTKKDGGYHKGRPGMWNVMEEVCNGGIEVKPEESFYVGDADGEGENAKDERQKEYQAEGVDRAFAENVGKMRGVVMEFYTPNEFFGRSNADSRKALGAVGETLVLSKEVMATRAALLGGYLSSPVLLVLIGVQGSGKTTLCKFLTEGDSSWCHYSQDTISKGKPGKREAVEAAAIASLKEGKNVVIDRMHLDADQRSHFVNVGKQCSVPVHALVMLAAKEEVHSRVLTRSNHPGKVEGVHGARMAVASLDRLTMPAYDEGFALISYTCQADGSIPTAYLRVSNTPADNSSLKKSIELYNSGRALLPMITFGTMSIGKRVTENVVSQAIELGIDSIDTAPTYKNESEVGLALANHSSVKVTIKVPKRVISASEARSEVQNSLRLLGRSSVDIVLLHWPSDLIEAGSLQSVWKELETMKADGTCESIGVCNFSIDALRLLLSNCEIKPAMNQVERHPLLPQYPLLEYCQSQGIAVQAHSPLGHGNKLLMEDKTILQVAKDAKLTAAQVLLLWNVQQGVPVITKFSSEEHGRDIVPILNSKIILSPEQMKSIDSIGLSAAEEVRFVAAPFMYKHGAVYSWGGSPPRK